jgi:hypothetical protein
MDQQDPEANERGAAETAAAMQDSEATEHVVSIDAMGGFGTAEPTASQAPEAAFTPPPPEALSAFVHAIEIARYPSPKPPSWWLATAVKKFDGLCAYCGRDIRSAPELDVVIPAVAGGPHRPDAAVLTCKPCKQQRRRRDLLLWKPDASTRLHDMRAELALDSWNHLSRDPATTRTPQKATEVIADRWRHPRFYCHGALLPIGGFIGWRDVAQVPSAIQLRLVFDHGGGRFRHSLKRANRHNNTAAIFWFPTPNGAVDALWDVIEHNGLVRRADLGDLASPVKEAQSDVSSDWAMVFSTVADLVRRRWRQQR